MTWTLRSGREMPCDRDDIVALYLPFDDTITEIESFNHEKPLDPPLTSDERREIAAAAKEAWDRWAETGES